MIDNNIAFVRADRIVFPPARYFIGDLTCLVGGMDPVFKYLTSICSDQGYFQFEDKFMAIDRMAYKQGFCTCVNTATGQTARYELQRDEFKYLCIVDLRLIQPSALSQIDTGTQLGFIQDFSSEFEIEIFQGLFKFGFVVLDTRNDDELPVGEQQESESSSDEFEDMLQMR